MYKILESEKLADNIYSMIVEAPVSQNTVSPASLSLQRLTR